MMTKIVASIIILNWNGAKELKEILSSCMELKNQSSYQIIIADNASIDESKKVAQSFPGVEFYSNEKNLFTGGYNVALPHVKGKYLFFTGNDIQFDPLCIQKLVEHIETAKNIAMVVPTMMEYDNHNHIDGYGTWCSRSFYGNYYKKIVGKGQPRTIPFGGTGLIRTDVCKQYNAVFDRDYFVYSEDIDLGLRIRLLGMRTVHVPEARVYHKGSTTIAASDVKSIYLYYMERNAFVTYFRICSVPTLFIYAPYFYAMRCVAMARDLLRLHFGHFFARLKALFWPLFHLNYLFAKRVAVQKHRKKPDSFVFAECSEKALFFNH